MFAATIQLAWFAWFFAVLGTSRRWAPRGTTPLEAALVATAVTGAAEYLIPLLSSLATAFTVGVVATLWVAVAASSLALGRRSIPAGARRALESARRSWTAIRSDRATAAWAAVIALLLAGTLASALLYPPTIWDSHAYHLPTALEYVQNQTVEPFPTYYAPMANTYPAAMYTLAQVKLLSGGDYLLNTIQWFSYLLLGATVFGLARKLGAGVRGTQFATLLAMAAPTIVLQASTTQHDLVVAMWTCSAAYLVIRLTNAGRCPSAYFWAVTLGLVVGVGSVTKITFVVCFALIAFWLALRITRRRNWHEVGSWMIALMIAVTLSSPFFGHNLVVHGDLLGTSMAGNAGLAVTDLSPGALWANLWRNVSLLFATPFASVNSAIESVTRSVGGALGVSVDSPVNLAGTDIAYGLSTLVTNPDWTGATATWLVVLFAVVVVLLRARRGVRFYTVAALAGLLTLMLVLTYSPHSVRLHMVPLSLLCAVAGSALTSYGRRAGWPARAGTPAKTGARRSQLASLAVAIVLSVIGLFVMAFHINQPLAPISVLTRGTLDSPGWWNTTYERRAVRTSLPFMEPELNELDRVGATVLEKWANGPGKRRSASAPQIHDHPTVLYGGSLTDAIPNYILMEHCARMGFAVVLQGEYGSNGMPGHMADETTDDIRELIVAYHVDRTNPQVTDCNGDSVLDKGNYTKVYERAVPELGGWATIWVWNEYL